MKKKMMTVLFLLLSSGCAVFENRSPSERERRAGRLLDSGIEYLQQHEYSKAKAAFGASFEMFPGAAALDGLGCVALMDKEYERAGEYFRQAVKLDESYSLAVHHLALMYDLSGNADEAQRFYRKALRDNPDSASLRNDYGAFIYDRWSRNKKEKNLHEEAKLLFIQSELLGGNGIGRKNIENLFEQDLR